MNPTKPASFHSVREEATAYCFHDIFHFRMGFDLLRWRSSSGFSCVLIAQQIDFRSL